MTHADIPPSMPKRRRALSGIAGPSRLGRRLAMAVFAVTVAAPLAFLAEWAIGAEGAFAVFVLAVVGAGWFGGLAPGLLATGLAALVLDLLIVPPRYHFEPTATSHLLRLGTFLLVSLAVGVLYERESAARGKAEELLASKTRAVEDLRATAEELRAANAAKDEFLGLVSHELKTPLTTIVLDADFLQRRGAQVDGESRQMMAAEIGDEAHRLSRIIDNLLTLARGDEVASEPVLLGPLVKRVVARHQVQHPQRPLSLSIAPGVIASAHPLQFEQVLLNLLSNAEKYSPADAPIDITVERSAGRAEVSVVDHGSGIAPAELARVFDAFYRSPATSQRAPGIGIGLAVCRRLVEAQDGQIWAAPEPGAGARFTFTLPLAEEPDLVPAR